MKDEEYKVLAMRILTQLDDEKSAGEFIKAAETSIVTKSNQFSTISQLYLAHKTRDAGKLLFEVISGFSAQLQVTLQAHAAVLKAAGEAADRQARGLQLATWALVFATFGLVVVELLDRFWPH